MGKSLLAPGFRFNPTDVELVKYYLKRKLMGKRLRFEVIAEVDIYKFDPWDLRDKSCWDCGDLKWYFFCPREKKYRSGNRVQRATEGGYWKTTGKDRSVLYNGEVVGWVKTLIFHSGRPPKGDRTDWVMHEYRLEDRDLADRDVPLDSYVICMIFQKEGLGPRNGAQYGAPFKEEDWSDNDEEISFEAVQGANIPEPDLLCNYNNPIATDIHSGSCISDTVPPSSNALQPVSSNCVTVDKLHASDSDDWLSTFDCFTEEDTFFMSGNGKSNDEICLESVRRASMPELPNNYNGSTGIGKSPESCTSDIVPPPSNTLQLGTGNYGMADMPHVSHGDDVLSMFDCFTEESAPYMHGNVINEFGGCLEAVTSANIPEPDLMMLSNNGFTSTNAHFPEVTAARPSLESCKVLQPVSCNYVTMEQPDSSNGDDVLQMLDCFAEESPFLKNASDRNELDNLIHFGNADASPHFNTSNVYEDLGDWSNMAGCSTDMQKRTF